MIRNNTNYSVLSTTRDPLGRFIILKIQIDDKVYVLVNIYAPNKDKDLIQFFRKLHGVLQMEDLGRFPEVRTGQPDLWPNQTFWQ